MVYFLALPSCVMLTDLTIVLVFVLFRNSRIFVYTRC